MKKTFAGYYRPSEAEFADLWAKATFAIDANVLLNFYGYSQPTRNALIGIFERLQDRLWLPHQFALEYQRNRPKAILEQLENYKKVRKDLRRILDEHFRSRTRHPFVSKNSLASLEKISRQLERGEREHAKLLTDDMFFQRISEIFEDRVGSEPSLEDVSQLQATAKDRYSRGCPPGFADKQKGEPGCYGDYIGWAQILRFASEHGSDVILVTDDRKEDWWLIRSDRTIGPRPELVSEFMSLTGRRFHMYSLDQFMVRAREYLGEKINANALAEIRERSSERREEDANQKPSPPKVDASKPSMMLTGGTTDPKPPSDNGQSAVRE